MSSRIGIYQITSPSNKVYIGQSWDIDRRWYMYSLGHCAAQRHLYNSIQKYGFSAHICQTLELFPPSITQSVLDEREQFFMDARTAQGAALLNLRGGGSTGKLSEETKERIRIANTGFNPTEETRRKLSAWQRGRKCPHVSDSNKRRAAAGTMFFQNRTAPSGAEHPRFGMKHSAESRAKMSVSQSGHTRATPKVRAVMSEKARGELNSSCRLTEAQAIEIRRKYNPTRYTAKDLAAEYPVSVHTIRRILSGRIWKHLVVQYPVRRRNHEWASAA